MQANHSIVSPIIDIIQSHSKVTKPDPATLGQAFPLQSLLSPLKIKIDYLINKKITGPLGKIFLPLAKNNEVGVIRIKEKSNNKFKELEITKVNLKNLSMSITYLKEDLKWLHIK